MVRITTTYDLLFSCPSDVSGICLPIIRAAVDVFNKTYGTLNNVNVMVKHWSTDSFPQSGSSPQELLNNQFVRDCDAAVAVFWMRFGTPTENYGSGTEEEIEEMISAGKQVFLYFLDKPIPPSEMISDEYKKVQEFKEKYKDKGIYQIIKDEHELQQQFTTHLGLYFLQKISDIMPTQIPERMPQLTVSGPDGDTEIEMHRYNLSESEILKNKNSKIISKIEESKTKVLPMRTINEVEKSVEPQNPYSIKVTEMGKQLAEISSLFKESSGIPLEVQKEVIETISEFGNENGIYFEDDYWYVGNLLQKSSFSVPLLGIGGTVIIGSDEEKEKYELIEDIYSEILCYRQYLEYFEIIDNFLVAEFVVTNSGTMHDEDIDVKIDIPKGMLVQNNEIPIPGDKIIEEINQMDFLKHCFCRKASARIDSYSDYPFDHLLDDPDFQLPFQPIDIEKEIEKNRHKYCRSIESFFCYEYFGEEDVEMLEFNIRYLKQHKSVYFPTLLLFKDIPEMIDYEIHSKNSSDIIKGRITFRNFRLSNDSQLSNDPQ